MSYLDVTGKTEEEAISNALRQLGMDRDDVSVEVLERAKSGFLGLGSCPAKIRVTYGAEEAPTVETKKPARPEAPAAPKAKPAEKPAPRPVEKAAPQPAEKPAPAPRREERPAPRREPAFQREEPSDWEEIPAAPHVSAAPAEELGEEVDDEKAQAIRAFLSGLLEHMECRAEIRVYLPEKGRYRVILAGDGLGGLIGRRGETLDAIQQLTSYSVNRSGSGRVRVQLDAENYREKREQSLEHLARKVAGKVVKYRRSVTLEPMNAYERHVIHTALQDVPGVTTYSTGTEPSRRVIVAYEREKK